MTLIEKIPSCDSVSTFPIGSGPSARWLQQI